MSKNITLAKTTCETLINKTLILYPTTPQIFRGYKYVDGRVYKQEYNYESGRMRFEYVPRDMLISNYDAFDNLIEYCKEVLKRDDYVDFLKDVGLLKTYINTQHKCLSSFIKSMETLIYEKTKIDNISLFFRYDNYTAQKSICVSKYLAPDIPIFIYIPTDVSTQSIPECLNIVDEAFKDENIRNLIPTLFVEKIQKDYKFLFDEKKLLQGV